jgi:periplasmic protein TonB
MTADFLRAQDRVADAFGLRAGRLMGSSDRGRADWVQDRRVQALSIAMHVTLVVLIAAPMLTDFAGRSSGGASGKQWVRFELPAGIRTLTEPRAKPAPIRGGGSGGDREAALASVGRLAPFNHLVFTPPSVKPPLDARLAMTPNLLGPPELHPPSPDMANWGNPLAPLVTDSSGPGHGGGIGTHCCGGVGDGDQGAGYGPGELSGTGGDHPIAGKFGYGTPVCVYCPQPNFSREAVEAKIQGSIFIEAVILRDGRPTQIRVVHGLGFGLDENAIEVVRKWRFKPATGPDGNAADVRMVIELAFRLY